MCNVDIAIAVFLAFVVKKKIAIGNTRLNFMHFISIKALLVTFAQMRVPVFLQIGRDLHLSSN